MLSSSMAGGSRTVEECASGVEQVGVGEIFV
jgi:hypothetical protein